MLKISPRIQGILALGVLVVGLGIVVVFSLLKKPVPVTPPETITPAIPTVATSTVEVPWQTMTVIGTSVEGRAIEAHTYGTGSTHLLFVGGIHGGYEWNSVLLAYEFMDYLALHPETVPPSLTIHVIPSLNPDGVFAAIGKEHRFTLADVTDPSVSLPPARFNAHKVDLNRNFDCKWQPESTWRGEPVSAGTAAFSEPEALALRNYVATTTPASVVFWHSQAGNVYASECEKGVLPATLTLMNTYAKASGYGAVPSFDAYPVTGDAEGWLAKIGIPAVTVELKTHSSSEWTPNLAGTLAVLALYASSTPQ